MLYTLYLEGNRDEKHEVQAFAIDVISEDYVALDLLGVKSVFPGAPKEIYNRLEGAIDILNGVCLSELTTRVFKMKKRAHRSEPDQYLITSNIDRD